MERPTAKDLLQYLEEQKSKELTKEDREGLEQLENYEKMAKVAAILYPITVWAAEKTLNKSYFKRLKGTNLFVARLPYNLMHLLNINIAYAGYGVFLQKSQKKAIKIAEKYDKELYILSDLKAAMNALSS